MRPAVALTLAFLSFAACARAQTVVNNETADRAFLGADGIAVPDAPDQSPGSQRRAAIERRTALFTAAGDVRLSRLLDAGLFATSGERLGTVRDVVLDGSGAPLVIVRTGGRTVGVPWGKLAFGGPGNLLRGKATLPGATRRSLDQLPEFKLPARAEE